MKVKRIFIVMIAAMLFTLLGLIGTQSDAVAQEGPSSGEPITVDENFRSLNGRRHFPGTILSYSGENSLNKRVVYKNDPSVTFVIGTVSGFDKRGIYLDGEYFSLTMADLRDSHGVPFTMKDLFYGMRVNLRVEGGSVKKVFAENLNTRVIRGKAEVKSIDNIPLEFRR